MLKTKWSKIRWWRKGKGVTKQDNSRRVLWVLVEAIIKHNLPFNFVEYEGIRKVFSYLNLDVKHIFRNTSKADVLKLYKKENDDIKNKL